MDFDDQLVRYFGTRDIEGIPAAAFEAGTDRMRVDFGLEANPGRRFALWALMYMLGVALSFGEAIVRASSMKSESKRDSH